MPVRVTIQDQQVEVQSDKGGKPIVLNMHARKNLNGDISNKESLISQQVSFV